MFVASNWLSASFVYFKSLQQAMLVKKMNQKTNRRLLNEYRLSVLGLMGVLLFQVEQFPYFSSPQVLAAKQVDNSLWTTVGEFEEFGMEFANQVDLFRQETVSKSQVLIDWLGISDLLAELNLTLLGNPLQVIRLIPLPAIAWFCVGLMFFLLGLAKARNRV